MEYPDDFLADQDLPYSGLDRILFLSCRRCFRYTPFLVYLPPNSPPPHTSSSFAGATNNESLLCCAGCLPENVTTLYPSSVDGLISNREFLRLIQGFEYSHPFYRCYAQLHRTLITAETRLEVNPTEFESLPLFERLRKLQELFPAIHLMANKRYSGLVEIGEALAARNEVIRKHYLPLRVEPAPAVSGSMEPPDTVPAQLQAAATSSSSSMETWSISSPSVPIVGQSARLRVLSSEEEEYQCDICLISERNTIQFGPFIEKPFARGVVRCHYFCLLSGTHIQQQGSDSAGVLGFRLADVKQSYSHYRNRQCYCCKQESAPIKCNANGCGRYFHYICGFRKGCLTQFIGEFHSYCHKHLPVDLYSRRHHPEQRCWICWDELPPYDPVANFHTICQPEDPARDSRVEYSWYHRDCLQKYAYEAGYYFKCPNCHEKDEFPNYARRRGIFVPMRDASWELDRTYFKDLHKCSCSAEKCPYANAKNKNNERMVGCKACGGETIHLKCAGIEDPNDYVCSKCMDATFIKLF